MPTILSGHCHTEEHAATPETAPDYHNRCAGAYTQPSGTLVTCPCPRHAGEMRCRICRHDHKDADEYDVASRRCADYDACQRRVNGRIDTCAAEKIRAAKTGTPTSPRKSARDCECGCGGQTRGGRFQPGHDAKMKSALLTRSRGGDEDATLELKRRGWIKE